MPESLLTRVKTKLYIASSRRAMHVLDGEYAALANGRSMDFEDLREYQAGDNIRDIDWKSSARSQVALVRDYIATRKYPVIFVVDAGAGMEALSPANESRKDLAIMATGILGYIAIRHSDSVSAIFGDALTTSELPSRSSESHLELILQSINSAISVENGKGDIEKQLNYLVERNFSRSMVVVVSSDAQPNDSTSQAIKTIQARHELLWISMRDGNPLEQVSIGGATIVDIETETYIPDFIRKNKKLKTIFSKAEQERILTTEEYLDGLYVSHVGLTSTNEITFKLIELLQRRLRERRR